MKTTILAFAALLLPLTGLYAGGAKQGKEENRKGRLLYETCATCHGAKGEGKVELGAPPIAGLPLWYLESTLNKFKKGVRGAHADDAAGLRMRPMARALKGDEEIKAVSQHVHELKSQAPVHTLGGDAKKGEMSFMTCVACHGPKGEGNVALKAPPIAGLPDWYVVAQLIKFKSGVRGTHPKDVEGAQMRPMAMALADEEAMKNVAATLAVKAGALQAKPEAKVEAAQH